jgi:hypothetical protein
VVLVPHDEFAHHLKVGAQRLAYHVHALQPDGGGLANDSNPELITPDGGGNQMPSELIRRHPSSSELIN